MKKTYEIVFNEATKTGEIFLYGIIGQPAWWSDNDSPLDIARFLKDFKKLEDKCDIINIRINSPGGSVMDGLPIYTTIARSKIETHSYIDGVACSMAAPIALACDKVHIASNALFMFHSAMSAVFGNAVEMREMADTLDKFDSALADSLVVRTELSKENVLATYFDGKNHWLTAEDAKALNIVDVIETYAAKDLPEDITNLTYKEVVNAYGGGDIADKLIKSPEFISKFQEFFNKINPIKTKKMKKEAATTLINSIEILNTEQKAAVIALFSSPSPDDLQAAKDEVPEAVQAKVDQFDAVNTVVTATTELFGEAGKAEGFDLTATVKELQVKAKTEGKTVIDGNEDQTPDEFQAKLNDPNASWNKNAKTATGK